MTSEIGNMEEQALKRKERLKALREKQQVTPETKIQKVAADSADENLVLPKPVFRSYQPLDDTLKEHQLPKVKPVEVLDKVKDQLEAAKPEPLVEEVDLMNLAPCKPDWDLKRDIAKKLDKLERRTQRAIAEIIRERILHDKDLSAVASWVADEGQSVSGRSSSVIGPKLPASNVRTAASVVGSREVNSLNTDENKARTADIGFDDDSD